MAPSQHLTLCTTGGYRTGRLKPCADHIFEEEKSVEELNKCKLVYLKTYKDEAITSINNQNITRRYNLAIFVRVSKIYIPAPNKENNSKQFIASYSRTAAG
jgi:hypothetical protein